MYIYDLSNNADLYWLGYIEGLILGNNAAALVHGTTLLPFAKQTDHIRLAGCTTLPIYGLTVEGLRCTKSNQQT
jgi:hypothetical protein